MSKSFSVDAAPSALSRWRELVARPLVVGDAISELIDNSLDAHAKNIDITWTGSKLRLLDDGHGCESPVLFMGDSMKWGDESMTGKFGAGMKHAALVLGGIESRFTVETGGEKFAAWRMSFRWKDQLNYTFRGTEIGGGRRGTEIVIDGDIKRPKKWDGLMQTLSMRYWHPLQHSIRITINRNDVPLPIMPIFDEKKPSIDREIDIDDERSVRVQGGIKRNPDDRLSGVLVLYRHRSVIEKSAIGCDGKDNRGVFVIVRLRGPWDVYVNKNGLSEKSEDLLDRTLIPLLQPLLIESEKRSLQIEDAEWIKSISAELNADRSIGKESRSEDAAPETDDHDHDGDGGGHPRIHVRSVSCGGGCARGSSGRRRNLWQAKLGRGEDDCLLEIDGPGKCIVFSESCPSAVSLWKEKSDENRARVVAIARCAMAVYRMCRQHQLPGIRDLAFGQRLAELYNAASPAESPST